MGLSKIWFSFVNNGFVKSYKKLVFLAILYLLYLLFFGVIPPDIYDRFIVLLTLLAGIVTTMAFFLFLSGFLKEDESKDPWILRGDRGGYFMGISSIVFFFAFSIGLLFYRTQQVSDILRTTGVYGVAKLVDTRELALGRTDLSSIRVAFYDHNKIYHEVEVDAQEEAVKKFKNKKYLPIRYARNYPTMVHILYNRRIMNSSTGMKVRPINLNDLLKLCSSENLTRDSVSNYLNSFDQKWELDEVSQKDQWLFRNIFTDETLDKDRENVWTYFYSEQFNRVLFKNEMDSMQFVRDTGQRSRLIYSNSDFQLEILHNNRRNTEQTDLLSHRHSATVFVLKKKKMSDRIRSE